MTSSVCSCKVEAAVEAARAAFPGWSSRSPQERSQVLQRLADLLEQSLEELAQAESKDQGERGLCWPLPSLSRPLSSGARISAPSCIEMRFLRCCPFTPSFQVVRGSLASYPYEWNSGLLLHVPPVGPSGPPTPCFSWPR